MNMRAMLREIPAALPSISLFVSLRPPGQACLGGRSHVEGRMAGLQSGPTQAFTGLPIQAFSETQTLSCKHNKERSLHV